MEAPSFNLPAINIGSRQRGRISAENVVFIDHNKKNIVEAIDKVRNDTNFIEMVNKCVSPYGNGNTTEKVIKVLKNLIIDNGFIYKNITY